MNCSNSHILHSRRIMIGEGEPLPYGLRARIERFFGIDTSEIHVYTVPWLERAGIAACTDGRGLYFAPGRYAPHSPAGLQLLGHELAHMAQQRNGRVRRSEFGAALVHDPLLEGEADAEGLRFAYGCDRSLSTSIMMKCAQPRGGVAVQCALARNAVRIDTRDGLLARGGDANDAGVTSPPANFRVPDFNINCTQKAHVGWHAQVQILHRADEGTNASFYLGPGMYSTDLMFTAGGALTNYVAGGGNRRVYVEISQDISTLSRQAEVEHCNDIVRAYTITLGAMQTALDNARSNGPYGPYDKRDKAMRAARTAITNGLHQRLATIVNNAVNVNLNVDRLRFRQDLEALYLTIAQMTQDRDAAGWHTFLPNRNNESWSLWSWTEYIGDRLLDADEFDDAFGERKDIRRLVQGPQTAIGIHPSVNVIHL